MNDDKYTIKSGLLDVGDGHKIYYQQWGNKESKPIFVLHGGPGSQSKDKNKLAFNPKIHNVIFHDQRGCGQSTFKELLASNTTEDLSNDINALRKFLKIDKILIFGYSWGSTLALYYAIKNTSVVDKLMIGGVFTGTDSELQYLYEGGISKFAPEAWDRFSEVIKVSDHKSAISHYHSILNSGSSAEKLDYLKRWAQLEPALASIDTDYTEVRQTADSLTLDYINPALISVHYFKNNCFMEDDFIFKNAKKLKNIPVLIVQGRFDGICPPETAYRLAETIGDNCHVHIVPGSHARQGALREVIKAYAWSWLT